MFASRRLAKELSKLHTDCPPGVSIARADNLQRLEMDIRVLDEENTLYKDQIFRLRFTFTDNYPIEPPEVQFIYRPSFADAPRPIPVHPHVYSNGVICLDLLGRDHWSPVQTVESICISIQSMLTGNTKNERPAGDIELTQANWRARDMRFIYDDDTV